MSYLVEFDESYCFSFLEDPNIKIQHPVSNYYLKLNDLSINLLISLKWVKWGYKFLSSISSELNAISDDYTVSYLIPNAIQNFKIFEMGEAQKLLFIDGYLVNSNDEFAHLLTTFYSFSIFDENTKIHMKLKLNLNLREYLIISNSLFPTFIKFQ